MAATQPGHHPGHPTAVGGLPASEPGLDAGTHDRQEAYRTPLTGGQRRVLMPSSAAARAARDRNLPIKIGGLFMEPCLTRSVVSDAIPMARRFTAICSDSDRP